MSRLTPHPGTVEDATDITFDSATLEDIGSPLSNVGIPTSGYVVLLLKQGWLYATGQAGAEFGLGISSTDYFLAEDVRFLSHYTTTGTSKFAGQGIGMMTGYQGTPQIAFFNVEKLGLPTGPQTIQVRAKQSSAGPGTIKGTSLTTKLAITTAEYR